MISSAYRMKPPEGVQLPEPRVVNIRATELAKAHKRVPGALLFMVHQKGGAQAIHVQTCLGPTAAAV